MTNMEMLGFGEGRQFGTFDDQLGEVLCDRLVKVFTEERDDV